MGLFQVAWIGQGCSSCFRWCWFGSDVLLCMGSCQLLQFLCFRFHLVWNMCLVVFGLSYCVQVVFHVICFWFRLVVVGFAWLFSVVLVASALCVVFMLCQDVEACVSLCEFVDILFQVALFLRSCSDGFKLSQVCF